MKDQDKAYQIFFTWKPYFFVCIIWSIIFLAVSSFAVQQKRVLFISSYHPGFPSFYQQINGIKSAFDRKNILLDIEHMDSKRFPQKEQLILFQNSLSYKLKNTAPYDAIIVGDDNALIFAKEHQNKLFNSIPIVFMGVNSIERALSQNDNPQITGVVEAVSISETIELMITICPTANHIVAIVDNTPSGQADLKKFYKVADDFNTHQFSEISLASQSWPEFLDLLSTVNKDTSLLLLSAYKDKNNRTYPFQESLKKIKGSLNLPIFHLWYHGIGDGLIGGKVISHFEQGKAAADLILQIISGTPIEQIKVVNVSPNKYVFDHLELVKFNIQHSSLPENSIILNNPRSFFMENRLLIWKIMTVSIILITALLFAVVNIFKRKKIEKNLALVIVDLKDKKQNLEQADIARQKAHNHLEESLEHFYMLFNFLPFSCVINDMNGRILLANKYFCETADKPLEKIIGRTPEDFGRTIDRDQKEKITSELKKHGSVNALETTVYQDGLEHHILFSSRLIDWKSEKAILSSTVDISDRKRAEDALKRNTELLKEAGRTAKVGAWSADLGQKSLVWSDEMGIIHDKEPGYSPTFDESREFIATEWRDKIMKVYSLCISEGISIDEEFEIITAKDRRRWVRTTGEAVRNKSGKITRIIGALQDISDRKKAEKERKKLQDHLIQARKMESVGILAGGIAHDFNNILSAVMGFTDLAMLEAGENEVLKEYLEQVSTSSLRARDLVRHMLTFSRKSDAKKQPISMNSVIKETLKFIRASLPASIEIRHDLKIEQEQVLGDSTQIHQILMNLFTNSGYAMKEKGGVLDVKLDTVLLDESQTGYFGKTSPGNYLQLTISDTGCGIHKKIIDRIFEPFFTTKEREEGTGMGLSTVYGILKEMRGGISVYSEEDVGTTFKILLPVHNHEKILEIDSKSVLKTGQGNILVVDDEKPIVEGTCKLLTRLGYSATGETDSSVAIENMKNDPEQYDLVLTDMTMPRLNGLDLAKQIKEINPEIPIVLCTGFSHGLTKEKCDSIGIFDMVMKPMIASELSLTVEKAMNRKE